jgi:hypothetical protein
VLRTSPPIRCSRHELLPGRWPGDALRSTYDDWDRAYRAVLSEWHRSQ